jgi:hypothetical protein
MGFTEHAGLDKVVLLEVELTFLSNSCSVKYLIYIVIFWILFQVSLEVVSVELLFLS